MDPGAPARSKKESVEIAADLLEEAELKGLATLLRRISDGADDPRALIWLIEGQSRSQIDGRDTREWTVAAYTDKEPAEEHMAKARRRAAELILGYEGGSMVPTGANEWDPNMKLFDSPHPPEYFCTMIFLHTELMTLPRKPAKCSECGRTEACAL